MARTISTGKCALCGGEFSKSAMTRHLTACQARSPARGKPVEALRLQIEGRYQKEYWLYLDVRADATLGDLDGFLRDIWLECCGHLSAFTLGGQDYVRETGGVNGMWSMMGMAPQGGSMNVHVSKVLLPGSRFTHTYDFGTSTELAGRVLSAGTATFPARARVRILARNLAPEIPCAACGKPATDLCAECLSGGTDEGCLCRAHARKHKCGEEMLLPVVNSPRVGACGYTGPQDPSAYFNP